MMAVRRWAGIVLVWLGVGAAALAWLVYALRESAATMPFDAGRAGIVAACAALLLAVAGVLLLLRHRGFTRRIGITAAAGAVVVLLLWLPFRVQSYTASEVSFTNGDVVLAGTLYEPRRGGVHQAVVLVHGSGPESRTEYAFLARYFARRGIAALAYDKRGAGASTGAVYAADYGDYARDALAGVRLLQSQPELDAARIGIVGISEAEWVAPLAAGESEDVAFIAVIGAAGVSPAEQVASEIAIRLRRRGYGDEDVRAALALNEQVYAYQRSGEGGEALAEALAAARAEPWFADAEDIPGEVHAAEDYAWWRSVMDFDASRAWSQVRVPVLLVKGGHDDRSPADVMRARTIAALASGGNDSVTVRVFPDADHMLLEWPLGERTPPPVFADGYLDGLVAWVKQQ
ncbi:MAG: alpha/beta hydrolase [Gemmatimonadota bacterium]